MCDVLVVDDQDLVREVMVWMLEDAGFSVREAATPDQALAIVQEPAGCTVLVTDIDLGVPDTDGFTVAAVLRTYTPGLPVVFVSGRPWNLAEHGNGPNERALLKPFASKDLTAAVHALLPH